MRISTFLPVIGIVIFFAVLSRVNVTEVINNFLKINIFLFLLSVGTVVLAIILKAYRWKMIVESYGTSFPLRESFKAWLIGFSIGLITPGKIGDLARSYYLRKRESIGKSLTTVMADRVIDVFILLILALIGLAFFTLLYVKNNFLLIIVSIVFVFFVASIFLFSRKEFSTTILKPFYKYLPKKYKSGIKTVYGDFYAGVEIFLRKKALLSAPIALTFLAWAIAILYTFLLALSMNLAISYTFLFMTLPLITLVLILPISLSGLGTREISFVFFLSYIGISAESAISLSLMTLFVDYCVGIFGFGLWHKNPITVGRSWG